jgi:hypothetical protein
VSHSTRTKEIDQAPGQEYLHLTLSHPMVRDVRFVGTLIQDVDLVAALNRFADIRQAQDMPRRDPVPDGSSLGAGANAVIGHVAIAYSGYVYESQRSCHRSAPGRYRPVATLVRREGQRRERCPAKSCLSDREPSSQSARVTVQG